MIFSTIVFFFFKLRHNRCLSSRWNHTGLVKPFALHTLNYPLAPPIASASFYPPPPLLFHPIFPRVYFSSLFYLSRSVMSPVPGGVCVIKMHTIIWEEGRLLNLRQPTFWPLRILLFLSLSLPLSTSQALPSCFRARYLATATTVPHCALRCHIQGRSGYIRKSFRRRLLLILG